MKNASNNLSFRSLQRRPASRRTLIPRSTYQTVSVLRLGGGPLRKLAVSAVALVAACIVALTMTGCATTVGQPPGAMEVRQGVIEQIMATQLQSTEHTGLGAVVGGVTGLGLGSLIGRGTGRDVAMLLGAVGGGLIGNNAQAVANDQPMPGQEVIVRTRSGVLVSVTQPINPELHEGQRVYLEGSGQVARVIAQY